MPDDEKLQSNAEKTLELFVVESHVILDISSCLHSQFGAFISNIKKPLKENGHHIIVFSDVMNELVNITKDSKHEAYAKAKIAFALLTQLGEEGVLAYFELKNGISTMDKMQELRSMSGKTRQTFITQDRKKAELIFNLNQKNDGSKIEVRQINRYGFLSPIRKNPSFKIVDTAHMYQGPFNVVRSGKTYEEGESISVIWDDIPKTLVLGEKISEGGEGVIFRVKGDDTVVVKIFKDEDISDARAFYSRKKVQLLLQKKMKHDSVCFPIAGVYDASNQLAGYVMPKVTGVELNKLLIGSQITIKKHFGENASRKETVRLCIAFLETVKYLHDENIVIGDLRTENIMVVSPEKIVIIDTDSFQLNEFPCPVGTALYTPPERITEDFRGMDKSKFMRTKSDDMFAVATILFQILMPSKEPYTKQDGSGEILQDIKIGDFAYARPGGGDTPHSNAPKGNWRFCWSHIEPNIRRMMYDTFMKGQEKYAPEKRYKIDEWLNAFRRYYKEIQRGKIEDFDPMSLDLIPIRFIKSPSLEYGKCKNPECKLDIVSVKDLKKFRGYCYRCSNTIIDEYTCPVCGENEIIYRLTDELAGIPKPERCKECGGETRVCVECGETFKITERRKAMFEAKGYELPKRCQKCLDKRNESRNNSTSHSTSSSQPNRQQPSRQQSSQQQASRQQPNRQQLNRQPNNQQQVKRPVVNPTPPQPDRETFWDKLKRIIGI